MQMTSKAASGYLFWLSGLMLGIGAGTEVTHLMVLGSFMTVLSLYYFRKFIEPKQDESSN